SGRAIPAEPTVEWAMDAVAALRPPGQPGGGAGGAGSDRAAHRESAAGPAWRDGWPSFFGGGDRAGRIRGGATLCGGPALSSVEGVGAARFDRAAVDFWHAEFCFWMRARHPICADSISANRPHPAGNAADSPCAGSSITGSVQTVGQDSARRIRGGAALRASE